MKILLCMAVGKNGKENFKRIAERIKKTDCIKKLMLLCFVYDDVDSNDLVSQTIIIKDKGQKWYFAKEYITKELVSNFDYILFWDDDLIIDDSFSFDNYFKIVKRNKLQVSQPALTRNSYYSHEITLQCDELGRETNFIEIMCPCYTKKAWNRLYDLITYKNDMGWGYDFVDLGKCGIIDSEPVYHSRPVQSNKTDAPQKFIEWSKETGINKPDKFINISLLK